MNPKLKKALFITGLCIDIGVTVFLFIIAIIMLATMPKDQVEWSIVVETNGQFIGYLQTHSTFYLFTCVVPLFVLLALNIIGLIIFVKKASKKPEVTVSDLDEATKAALKEELLKDLQKDK